MEAITVAEKEDASDAMEIGQDILSSINVIFSD
jgi:hypothetical protein